MKPMTIGHVLQEAVSFHSQGKLREAEQRYRSVLAVDRGNFDALHCLGVMRVQQGRYGDAFQLIQGALKRHSRSAEAHSNLGHALLGLKRNDEAAAHCRTALELKADYPEAHNNLGLALLALGMPEEAIASWHKALSLSPYHSTAHHNIGLALETLGRHEEAVPAYQRALAINPTSAEAHTNLGNVLQSLRHHEEALGFYRVAVAIAPDYADAHWNAALAHLALGDFENGWREYEWRWRTKAFSRWNRTFRQPLWLGGQEIAGRSILLHAEQGFGDTIQFVRYAPLVAARGARVIVEVQPELQSLLASLTGVTVVAEGSRLPAYDYHCPLLSLPLAFATTLDTVPAELPYLAAPAEKLAPWRAALGELRAPRVGLVWSGSTGHKNDLHRSIALLRLVPLLRVPGLQWVSIQKEVRTGDEGTMTGFPRLLPLGESLQDFSDTAALISLLDLVITVDTAVAHLAGAMGKPVWLLLHYASEWRWLLERDDSPWYPGMRLFRQSTIDGWEAVIDRVAHELAHLPQAPERP